MFEFKASVTVNLIYGAPSISVPSGYEILDPEVIINLRD